MGTVNSAEPRASKNISLDRSASEEQWRPVVGFEGWYEVSNLGRIKSVARLIIRSNGCVQRFKERIRKITTNTNGYKAVTLNFQGNYCRKLVSHMVAEAFIGPRPHGKEVSHEDGDLENNKATNFLYRSKQSNNALKKQHGTYVHGDKMPWAKLKNADIPKIRELVLRGGSYTAVGAVYQVSAVTISRIARGKTWINC